MTASHPHLGWIGRLERRSLLPLRRGQVRADMAALLDAQPWEVDIVEIPDRDGVWLLGSWWPPP